jgi:glycosyltransferase involved in cell wall biosynthesis
MPQLISVILPSYNHAHYIGEAIDSVLQQSHSNFELIVVDDGSTDNSLEVIKSYSDERISIIEQSNSGAHNAINRGLNIAHGEYLTILNSDDRYYPDRFEKMLQSLQYSEGDFCFSNLDMIDAGSDYYRGWRYDHYHELCKKCRDVSGNVFLVANPAFTTSNFFFSRKAYDHVGEFYNLRYTHDWNWVLRYSAECQVIWLDEKLMDYRVHDSNTLLESAVWNHLFEDSYNFSCYLHTISQKHTTIEDINSIYLDLLLRNESYVAVAVAVFLAYLGRGLVKDDKALLQLLQDDTFRDKVITLVKNTKLNSDVFLSYQYLSNKIFMHDHYKKVLAEKEKELEHVLALLESEKLNNRSFIQRAKKKLQGMFPFSR